MPDPRFPDLFDMHCHLGFSPDGATLAKDAAASGIAAFSTTVTPDDYLRDAQAFAGAVNVCLGAGLHPWYVDGATDIDAALETMTQTRFIGEVGLDFGAAHRDTHGDQIEAFSHVAEACAQSAGKVLSLHAVRSADAVLDILEQTGCADTCRCIMHWFSGNNDELVRAVRMGCWFSVGLRMLNTRKGRAYVQAIPTDKLLLETDLPASVGETLDSGSWRRALDETMDELERITGRSLREQVAQSSRLLLA